VTSVKDFFAASTAVARSAARCWLPTLSVLAERPLVKSGGQTIPTDKSRIMASPLTVPWRLALFIPDIVALPALLMGAFQQRMPP
jgi:hypothetical protein